ncbi:MAG: ChbG/HpnK family deacetylase [Planctomycetia bacterium]|nr:ChbG/HpnK family deacetylase [Planctomycetia bacterium]
MPFCEEGIQSVVRIRPDFDFGLHFCLTSGRPVASPEQVSLLLDSQGMFRYGFYDLWKLSRNPEVMRQIKIELEAQWNRAVEILSPLHCRIQHFDSHQHIHAIPAIFDLAAKKSQEEHVRIRVPVEEFGSIKRVFHRFFYWFPKGFIKREILKYFSRNIPVELRKVHYIGILDSGKMSDHAWQEILRAWPTDILQEITVEVNIHPATSYQLENYHDKLICSADDRKFWGSVNRVHEYDAIFRLPEMFF